MAPAPLCKTAIIKFLIDKETFNRLWNLSSNMRKRLQMILEQMEITLGKYNEKALKIKEWVRIGNGSRSIRSIQDIKKGISNYELDKQTKLDKVLSLNGKLRCYEIDFPPNKSVEIDYIEYLRIDSTNYNFSKCSFNKCGTLSLYDLSFSQIKEMLPKFKIIDELEILHCSLSKLDLRFFSLSKVKFFGVTFLEAVKLPLCLDYLWFNQCENPNLIKCKRVTEIKIGETRLDDLIDWIQSLKGVKEGCFSSTTMKFIDYLPNTVRVLNNDFGSDNVDFSSLNKQFPLLIKTDKVIPIQAAQTLNLRSINPEMSETEEKFTLRPRKIWVHGDNVEQLNKHPELFERVEKVTIWANEFNFDCLPAGVKEICLWFSEITEENLENLKKNNWKFENTVIHFFRMHDYQIEKVLDSLNKVKKIRLVKNLSLLELIENYPQFKFIT